MIITNCETNSFGGTPFWDLLGQPKQFSKLKTLTNGRENTRMWNNFELHVDGAEREKGQFSCKLIPSMHTCTHTHQHTVFSSAFPWHKARRIWAVVKSVPHESIPKLAIINLSANEPAWDCPWTDPREKHQILQAFCFEPMLGWMLEVSNPPTIMQLSGRPKNHRNHRETRNQFNDTRPTRPTLVSNCRHLIHLKGHGSTKVCA